MALLFHEGETPPKSESEMADGITFFPPEEVVGDVAALCKFLQQVVPTQQRDSRLLLGMKRGGRFGWILLDQSTATIPRVADDILIFRMLMPVATSGYDDGIAKKLKMDILADLKMDLKMEGTSVNSASQVGEVLVNSPSWCKPLSEKEMEDYLGDPVTSVDSMMDKLLMEKPTWETLAERGRAQYNKDAEENRWKRIKRNELRNSKGQHNEKFVQLAIWYLCCRVENLCPEPQWHAIDTSVSGIPGDGRKPDISLCTIRCALWLQIVTVLELKDNHNSTNYSSAVGQLKDRADTLFLNQPGRSRVITSYIAKGIIDLVVIEKASWEKHSGVLSFEFDKESAGLRLFMRMLLTSNLNLGFIPVLPPVIPITPRGAIVTHLSLVFIAKSVAAVESDVDTVERSPRGTKVYFCEYEYKRVTRAAVLKVGRVGKEVENLNRVQGISGITRLLDTGCCPDGAYLITYPRGTRLNLKMVAADILVAASQIASTIKDLYFQHKMLHRDISIGNIIWVKEENRAHLIDWATANEFDKINTDDPITGTPLFASIHVHRKNKSNVSTELESLMYVLMFTASDGHLPWRRKVLGYSKHHLDSSIKAVKMGIMCNTHDFNVWVEQRAWAWDPTLKRAVENLRTLFFPDVYRTDVTTEEFIGALKKID